MTDPVLDIGGLTYRYPGARRDTLADVNLSVDGGEFLVLAGRSGSGKTTLLRAACGLVPHFHGGEVRGRIEVAGEDTRVHPPGTLAAAVGYVSQDPETQVVSTTVRGELALPLELRGRPEAERARAVEEVALALGLAELLDRAVDTLSGGELQRVALAAALVMRPPLVLLDEPTSQLDPVAGDELIWLLRRLNEEWGVAVLLCEHRLERCLAAADRAIAMRDGRITFDGPPDAFQRWALDRDDALTTPAARLFDLAGLESPPVGVRAARNALKERDADQGLGGAGIRPPAQPFLGASRAGNPRAPQTTALRTKDLWVELDPGDGARDVVQGLDLQLDAGERVALMGRNGAGKSTLLRAAAGLVEPARGRIEAPAGTALLPQSPADFMVRERVGDELPGEAGHRALDAVDLAWAVEADPRDLSGGERQRLALAIAMAGRGDGALGVAMLDEPTRGMDPERKRELAAWIAELAAGDTAVLVATHDVEFAAAFAERVVLLAGGRLIADAPATELLSGGWYFTTEVARILETPGAITPEQGAELLRTRPEVART
jgi:energy-coupling factor transporter ATP-binding protein EcfA2